MSFLDDTATDVPVRDLSPNVPRLTLDTSSGANTRVRQDVQRMSREELEDKFLRLNDENLNLKQHINNQDDKIKKLATKLMRLVKDRSRLEKLSMGAPPHLGARVRDVGMEELIEELQENIRSLQNENEGLKQRLRVAKQQIIQQQGRRAAPYSHIHSRINSGMRKLRDSPSPPPLRPKSARSLEGAGRPPTGQLPRYGHSLLEEARAEIRNLENVIESQRSHIEELQEDVQLLRDERKKNEAEFEERLLEARQQQASSLRTHVGSNVNMIKLQKQLSERANVVTELEGRFLQLKESQQRLKASHDSALSKVESVSVELKQERLRSMELEEKLRSSAVASSTLRQLQEQISELEQEKDLLKENNNKLLNSAFDVSQQQRWQIQERKLQLQISQLETALQADLVDKNQILDKVKAERETNEKLMEENQKLHVQFLEQKQQLDEMKDKLKVYSKDSDYDVSELTEALLLVKRQKTQRSGELGFLSAVGDELKMDSAVKELKAAHAETIQELEKTRSLLSVENQICRGYKAELDTVTSKLKTEQLDLEHRLENQAKLLDSRAARIKKLEAQLKDIAYGTKAYVFKPEEDDAADGFNNSILLERGENVLELQITSVTLSSSALQSLSDAEPTTFCTYQLHHFELHSTPVVSGLCPRYGFTSQYVVRVERAFVDYLCRGVITVELHQAKGLDWSTLASGQIRLQPLMEREGKVHGSIPLIGASEEVRSFGSLDYWFRLRIPMRQTLLLYQEKLKAMDYVSPSSDPSPLPVLSDAWNELCVSVHSCRGLRSRSSASPSAYVIYRFNNSPDYPSDTAPDSTQPQFNDSKLYAVAMDQALHRYLLSALMQFYVFDEKEDQMDVYLGKAQIPLTALTQDKDITGEFELYDPSGLPAGHIQVSLKWKLPYLPPPGSEEPEPILGHQANNGTEDPLRPTSVELTPPTEPRAEDGPKALSGPGPSTAHPNVGATKAPLPKLRQRALLKEGAASKKVTFVEESDAETQLVPDAPPHEVEEEEVSHFSEGQLLASSSQSDDSDQISDHIQDVQNVPKEDQSQSTDSDDCIVQAQPTGRKVADRLRVEVVSLSLWPDSRVSQDPSVVRLYVEYSLLDVPTVETPVSLPKPPQGHSVSFNYSKVIPVDPENHSERRRLLRSVLQGKRPEMEMIRFTVVSEPLEEEQQERECEDVGVAFLKIPEILQKKRDLHEAPLNVLDAEDQSAVIGVLTVSVEGKKNNNPAYPDYTPSIFPQAVLKELTKSTTLDRFKRAQKRKAPSTTLVSRKERKCQRILIIKNSREREQKKQCQIRKVNKSGPQSIRQSALSPKLYLEVWRLGDVEKRPLGGCQSQLLQRQASTDSAASVGVMSLDDDARWLEWVTKQFESIAGEDKEIDLDEFKTALKVKESFFAERFFALFDSDGSKTISLNELLEALELLIHGTETDKLRFLFQVYDVDGSGSIDPDELRTVLKSCLRESAISLPEEKLDDLTLALFESADKDNSGAITFEELKAELETFPEVMENLTISAANWLKPPEVDQKKRQTPRYLTASYWQNNSRKLLFLMGYSLLSLGLFSSAMWRSREGGPWYMLARGCGQCLNFNCTLILVLMLRRCLTWLRATWLVKVLPLDQSVLLHQIVGYAILSYTLLHTCAHLFNFAKLSESGKFLFWEYVFTTRPGIGWVKGTASLTGVVLQALIFLMVVCSMTFVRRSGHFEVFYWSHLSYIWVWTLLVIHCANFWKWFVVPGVVFLLEKIIGMARSRMGSLYIAEVNLLPSKVTHLVIHRPQFFQFKPGDYVYINIPAIAKYEWHPFTISSAPEQSDTLWLHVRSMGQWTNRLYEYFRQPELQDSPKRLSTSLKKKRGDSTTQETLFSSTECLGAVASNEDQAVELTMYRPNRTGSQPEENGQKLVQSPETKTKPQESLGETTPRPNKSPESGVSPDTRGLELLVQTERGEALNYKDVPSRFGENHRFCNIKCYVDGPYGTPTRQIFASEHAVLIGAGIGITPFASILQSIMYRYRLRKQNCPNCSYSWCENIKDGDMKLRKVDFIWINRDQKSFEWFVSLLTKLEMDQADEEPEGRFLEMHMYMTSALSKNDMKAIGLQMALDLLAKKEKRDSITGLRTRTQPGRPNWAKVFHKVSEEKKGKVHVFYCGSPALAKVIKAECENFGFHFYKENF
uniref:Uncharacterized protein n=1 Tax=Knipowitschia caucasica TaxID=637954 RepID=A0AAV2L1C1_KNICA